MPLHWVQLHHMQPWHLTSLHLPALCVKHTQTHTYTLTAWQPVRALMLSLPRWHLPCHLSLTATDSGETKTWHHAQWRAGVDTLLSLSVSPPPSFHLFILPSLLLSLPLNLSVSPPFLSIHHISPVPFLLIPPFLFRLPSLFSFLSLCSEFVFTLSL